MGWLLNTICKAILRTLAQLFGVVAEDFITLFGINIGADFPTLESGNKSLISVLNSYGSATSVFDLMFPVSQFKKILVGIAITIATGLFVIELMKVLASPMTRSRKQHPAVSVVKYALAIPGIIFSYRIFICLEYIGNEFYRTFGKVAVTGMKPTKGALPDMFSPSTGKNIFDALYNVGEAADFYTGGFVLKGLAATVFNLIMVWLLFSNFLRFLIEVVERYVVLGVLFYTAPLPFATLASEETRHIFTSWLKMTLSQMLLMITNGMFISVFIAALIKITTGGSLIGFTQSMSESAKFSGRLSWSIWMILLVAWLLLAQRFDSYLNSLGLSTAHTGGGLAAAVRSGVIAAGSMAAAMGTKYAGSDLRKNMKSQKPGLDTRFKTAVDSAKNSLGKTVKGALGGDTSAHDRALNNQNTRREIGDALKSAGLINEGKAVANHNFGDTALKGDSARNAGMTLSGNNKAMQQMLKNAKNLEFGSDKDGNMRLNGTTKDGEKFQIAYGDPDFGSSVGKGRNGIEMSMSGSASTIDKVMSGEGSSATAQAAQSYAKTLGPNYDAVKLDTGQYGIENLSSGEKRTFAPQGADDIVSPKPAMSGYVTGEAPANVNSQPIAVAQAIEEHRLAFETSARRQGFDPAPLYGTTPLSSEYLSGALNVMQASPQVRSLFDHANSCIPDGSGGYTLGFNNGSELYVNQYDISAGGSHANNGMNQPMMMKVVRNDGSSAITQAMLAMYPETTKIASQFSSFLADMTGLDVTTAITDDGFIAIQDETGDEIARVAPECNADVLFGNGCYKHGGYAIQMTDAGKHWYSQETGLGFDATFVQKMFKNE